MFFFFKQKTAYEMRISDWSSDVCSSDLPDRQEPWAGKDGRACRRTRPRPRRRPVLRRGQGSARCEARRAGAHARRRATRPHRSEQVRNRSEEHTSELQSLMRISYAVFCLKKKNKQTNLP